MFGTKEEKVRIREMFFFLFYFNALLTKKALKRTRKFQYE